jgi:hypothetical protein
MTLWEFHLEYDDGTLTEQTVLAEGEDEDSAMTSAASLIDLQSGVVLSRPGKIVLPEIETRWREIYGDAFPGIVSDTGRLALYARGITKSSDIS